MKGFLWFLLGAGVGSGVTYIFTKRACNKKNDNEIAKLESYYKDKIPKKEPKKVQDAPRIDEKPSEEALKLEERKQYVYDAITNVRGTVTDYAAKYKSTMRREEDEDPIPDGNKPYLDSDVDNDMANEIKGMVIISGQEWDEDDGYDKREVTYYENDEIFTDMYNERIDNLTPDDFGRANLEHFGVTGEEGVLYCRDEDNMTDYRISLEESAYEY